MKVRHTALPGVLIIEPDVFSDWRGDFFECHNSQYNALLGIEDAFVQDNLLHSKRNVLRGLHLQHPGGQGKLVSVIAGAILDVAVDVRPGSPAFARHVAVVLDSVTRCQFWIPKGFAHGFLVLSESADIFYKCDAPYSRAGEMSIRWDDPVIGIEWPAAAPILPEKDAAAPPLKELTGRLPPFR